MNVYNFNIESWWSILKNLNNDIKLELASRLIDSIKKPVPPIKEKNDEWMNLAGSWKDETQTAAEMIKFLRDSRVSTRQIESLD